MTSAVLIPCAQTDWQAAGRFVCQTPMKINARGEQQIGEWARIIDPLKPRVIYGFEKDPAAQTARMLADTLHIKAKMVADLAEVSIGLWEGLTPEQLQKRFARAYKQWKGNPCTICPPDGEKLTEADERLSEEFHKLAKKHEQESFGVVLGTLAFATLRCNLEDRAHDVLWQMTTDNPVKYVINLDRKKAISKG